MKTRLLLLCALCLLACVPAARRGVWFSGLIVYHNEFRNAAGDVLDSNLGAENLFISTTTTTSCARATRSCWSSILAKPARFSRFWGDKTTTTTAADSAAASVAVTHLPTTAVILGRPCRAVQLVHGAVASIVYYSPEVRVNPKGFSKSPFGYWYALLKATDGALPLRTISVYSAHGYTATTEATAVQALPLTNLDFTTAAPAR